MYTCTLTPQSDQCHEISRFESELDLNIPNFMITSYEDHLVRREDLLSKQVRYHLHVTHNTRNTYTLVDNTCSSSATVQHCNEPSAMPCRGVKWSAVWYAPQSHVVLGQHSRQGRERKQV